LKEDLPYFTELLGEVITKTRYTTHELKEEVFHVMKLDQKGLLASPLSLAINSVHSTAFHRGLGVPTNATSSTPFTKYLDAQAVADYSDAAYARNNIAVVANGADHAEFAKWVKEFFQDTKTGSTVYKLSNEPAKYYGGEERIAHASADVMVIAFPGSSSFTSGESFKPELTVLAALLGGQSSVKWSPGFSLLSKAAADFPQAHVSTQNAAYTDTGLLYVTITGKASDIAKASKAVVDTLKSIASGNVSEEDITKATALAKFRALEAGQQTEAGLEATGMGLISNKKAYQIDELGQRIGKVTADQVKSVSSVIANARATANIVVGCQVITREPCYCIFGWRSVCPVSSIIAPPADVAILIYEQTLGRRDRIESVIKIVPAFVELYKSISAFTLLVCSYSEELWLPPIGMMCC